MLIPAGRLVAKLWYPSSAEVLGKVAVLFAYAIMASGRKQSLLQTVRNTLSALSGTTSDKRGVTSRTEGEIILKLLDRAREPNADIRKKKRRVSQIHPFFPGNSSMGARNPQILAENRRFS